jgi:hypothetical protein
MTSTVKVNNVQASDGGNIINQCGTNITIGASGDTIALASGASQTGFGRTGTVDWQTAIKTGDFTAANGEGYFVNTTSGQITVTLPASPSAGDIVAIKDYANTFDSNSVVLGRNGSNIDGTAEDAQLIIEGLAVTLVYADATKGWLYTDSASKSDVVFPAFITATGGTITTVDTNFKVHTFTGPGTFTVCSVGNAAGSNTVDYLVVAGGGGSGGDGGGGGGAGGFRVSNSIGGIPAPSMTPLANPTGLPVTATGYPVVVGAGGAGAAGGNAPAGGAAKGSDSVFSGSSTITSTGGGQTGCYTGSSGPGVGFPGGSGGGGSRHLGTNAGGTGNTPPVSPPQGNPGGTSQPPTSSSAAGGGAGAAGVTVTAPGSPTQDGGVGTFVATTFAPACVGTPGPSAGRWFAGGGAAGGNAPGTTPSTGGAGGGGNAINSENTSQCGTAGTTNTGGGAGGGGNDSAGKTGGSGIVIIRYKFQ